MSYVIFNNHNNNQRLNEFSKYYDLIHSYDYLYDLHYFFINGKFYDWKLRIDDNVQSKNKTLRKSIQIFTKVLKIN